jgi:hypothetical protein
MSFGGRPRVLSTIRSVLLVYAGIHPDSPPICGFSFWELFDRGDGPVMLRDWLRKPEE